jgi:hypothetical protein
MKALIVMMAMALSVSWPGRASAQNAVPSNPHGTMAKGVDCADCHTAANWKVLRAQLKLDHSRFPLAGKHSGVPCARCHLDLRFDEPKIAPTQCASCHADVHRGNMNGECVRCHTATTFREVPSMAIHNRTGFPLSGAHLQTPCEGCHRTERNGAYTAVPRDCLACHRATLAAASASVDHSGFPSDCTQCHGPMGWRDAAFDHTVLSRGFNLLGAHARIACSACHIGRSALRFVPAPTGQSDCNACHQSDYRQAHPTGGFPTACATCHTVNSWGGATFDHAALSHGFVLVGAHQTAACSSCHIQPGNALKFSQPAGANDCATCHQSDYTRAHAGTGFPTTCSSCHTQNSWSGATFDHATVANGYQLIGAHGSAACTSCHIQPGNALKFSRPANASDCVACHQPDYNREHTGSGFPTTCLSCHTQSAWTPSTFDHTSYFPIASGNHQAGCTTCHTTPGNNRAFTCFTCHEHAQAPMDQKHQGRQGYVYDSQACYNCHPRGRAG